MMKKEKQKAENPERLNRIVEGTKIIGDLTTNSSLRMDGAIEGNINCIGRLVVGKEGFIQGNIHSNDIEINGMVVGQIQVEELLTLHKTAVIKGDIQSKRIIIEDGAQVIGNILTGDKSLPPQNNKGKAKIEDEMSASSPDTDMIF